MAKAILQPELTGCEEFSATQGSSLVNLLNLWSDKVSPEALQDQQFREAYEAVQSVIVTTIQPIQSMKEMQQDPTADRSKKER